MRDRLLKLGIGKEKLPYISTLHSLAARIVQQNPTSSSLPDNFIIVEDEEKDILISDTLEDLGINFGRRQKGFINNISVKLSLAKSNCQYPDDISDDPDFKQIYNRYQTSLSYNYAVDFDDLILEAIKIVHNNTEILERYREEAKYFLIDEYQDINEAQYRLIKHLAKDSRYFFACGDNHQSIYGFRGSSPFYINNFKNDFPDAIIKELTFNYRTPHHILEGALNVVEQNSDYVTRNINCVKDDDNKIIFLQSTSELSEVKYITQRILANNGKFGEITILYPNFKITKHIIKELRNNNIPYVIAGAKDNSAGKNIKCYLRLLLNRQDNLALRQCMKITIERQYTKHIRKIRIKAEEENKRIWEILENYQDGDSKYFKNFIKNINKLEPQKGKLNLVKMIDNIVEEINCDDASTINCLKNIIGNLSDECTLKDFVDEIKKIERENIGVAETGEGDINRDVVSMMSVFRAKGLQNKIIFIVGMLKGIFPREPIDNIEEQRRICYVAMTRAEEELYMCYSTRHKGPGSLSSEMFFERSPFLEYINSSHTELKYSPKN